MKELNITLPVVVKGYDELTSDERTLVEAAQHATAGSYSPYSHFKVGAAIRLADGSIVTGANQENAAFPSGTCAERSACFYAGATHPGVAFEAIAIAAIGTDGKPTAQPTAPCGACRQALLEYEMLAKHPVPVLLAGADEVYIVPSVKALLPLAFTEF
ncbi:MAG: cytidine deaminase [Muribaculaceae bacterium]|nr:cytidine deaminase [Muribaculaceae bacterium]